MNSTLFDDEPYTVTIKISDKKNIPTYGTAYSAGCDLKSSQNIDIKSGTLSKITTGLYMNIPTGFYGKIESRSSVVTKLNLQVMAGIIDSDYRGEIIVCLYNFGSKTISIKEGDRIAQLIIQPYFKATFKEVDKLDDTDRGTGGFGSTDK